MKNSYTKKILAGISSLLIASSAVPVTMFSTAAADSAAYGDANCDGKVNLADAVLIPGSGQVGEPIVAHLIARELIGTDLFHGAQPDQLQIQIVIRLGRALRRGVAFDVEDLAMGFIKFDNGACLQVEVSWASNVASDDFFFELRGTKEGAIQNQNTGGKLMLVSDEGDCEPDISAYTSNQGHGGNIRHFVDVVLNGAEPAFVPQQGINMVKILEAIYKSAETGREILL